jgi:DNA polymerase V
MDTTPATESQLNLFVRFEHSKHIDLMKAMDQINSQWGSETLRSGAAGITRPWGMKRARLSPAYTTNWEGLLRVGCVSKIKININ